MSKFDDTTGFTEFEKKLKVQVYNASSTTLLAFKALVQGFKKMDMSRAQVIRILKEYWSEALCQ